MKKNLIYAMILCALTLSMTACGDAVTDESKTEIITEASVSSEESETKAEKQISATQITEEETSAASSEAKESETAAPETAETKKSDAQENNAPANNNGNNSENNNNSSNAGGSQDKNDDKQPENNDEPPASSGEFTKDDLIFRYDGKEIYLDENINDVIAKLGEPNDIEMAKSCQYIDYYDKTFIYDGFNILTYPDGENDYVVWITITEAGIKTEKGAEVGMSISDALAIYGDDYANSGSNYQYQIDDKYMYFYVENDIVCEIGIVYAN